MAKDINDTINGLLREDLRGAAEGSWWATEPVVRAFTRYRPQELAGAMGGCPLLGFCELGLGGMFYVEGIAWKPLLIVYRALAVGAVLVRLIVGLGYVSAEKRYWTGTLGG